MASQPPGPFGEQDFEEIKRKLADLDQADLLIAQSERGGIAQAEQKVQSAEMRTKLKQLAQAFFPGRSLR